MVSSAIKKSLRLQLKSLLVFCLFVFLIRYLYTLFDIFECFYYIPISTLTEKTQENLAGAKETSAGADNS